MKIHYCYNLQHYQNGVAVLLIQQLNYPLLFYLLVLKASRSTHPTVSRSAENVFFCPLALVFEALFSHLKLKASLDQKSES